MDVRKCERCGRLYTHILGINQCPECKKQEEEEYHKVKNYVYDHKGATILEVSNECGVDKKYIKQWLKEDRLQLTEGTVDFELTCEQCGKPITSGRFCPECKTQNIQNLQKMAPEKPKIPLVQKPKTGGPSKMRFFTK